MFFKRWHHLILTHADHFFCIPKILWVTLRSEWGHPTNRQNLDYNSESWHKWGEQPQAESEWIVVSSSALYHPDHSQERRGSYEGCRPAFPSEYIVPLASNSSFIQTLGNMVESSEWGEFHEEVIYHDEKWERIKRFEQPKEHYQDHSTYRNDGRRWETAWWELFISGTWEQWSAGKKQQKSPLPAHSCHSLICHSP